MKKRNGHTMSILEQLKYDEEGLVPAVVQDWRDGTVLMVGFMNREALSKTLETKSVHFWSRSRGRLWEKGETSGNRLGLKELFVDCDHDTVLIKAQPVGPTCHTGERACFFTRVDEHGGLAPEKTSAAHGALLDAIYRTVQHRKAAPRSGSYVSTLFEKGQDAILKKVAEEAAEVILASKTGKRDDLVHEVADLFFHTLVVLGYHDLSFQEVYDELGARFGRPGLRSAEQGKDGG